MYKHYLLNLLFHFLESGPDILNITQERSTLNVSDTPFSATLVRLSSLFTVYGVSVSFSLEDESHVVKRQLNSQENDITCTIVWLNENLVPVMMSRSMNGYVKWMNGWMDQSMNEWMDGSINEWMDQRRQMDQ